MSAILHSIVVGIEHDRIKAGIRNWLIKSKTENECYDVCAVCVKGNVDEVVYDLDEAKKICDCFELDYEIIREFEMEEMDLEDFTNEEIASMDWMDNEYWDFDNWTYPYPSNQCEI